MKPLLALSLGALFFFTGCIQHIAVTTVGSIVNDGFDAFTEEQDLEFAAQALPSNLKLLEVMLKNEPENESLLRLLAEGYNSYALGFVEDTDPERAKIFYLRATDYALQLVRQDAKLAKAFDGTVDDLKAQLAKRGKDGTVTAVLDPAKAGLKPSMPSLGVPKKEAEASLLPPLIHYSIMVAPTCSLELSTGGVQRCSGEIPSCRGCTLNAHSVLTVESS
ncbi:MAG: transporter T-component [Bacteroidetes bacterium]|nr:transporter T-component [Bacteroidota bacterium]